MYNDSRKKQRGQKRKLSMLCREIEAITPAWDAQFPYDHFHVPCSFFISHPKTRGNIKTQFCQKWLEKTEALLRQKPENIPFCKIVALICYPDYWESQIIIFYSEDYYTSFFERNGEETWERVTDEIPSYIRQRNIQTHLTEVCYRETILEDGSVKNSLLWFYGI